MGHSSGFVRYSEPIPTYRYILGREAGEGNLTGALRHVAMVAKFLDNNKPKHIVRRDRRFPHEIRETTAWCCEMSSVFSSY